LTEFFEPPAPRPEPPRPARPELPPWLGAPTDTLPGVVALELVLARTARVAVCVSRLEAYPTGFELDLVTMARDDSEELDPMLFQGSRGRGARRGGEEMPDAMLRFGVEFADGAKATNTADQPLGDMSGGYTHTFAAVGGDEARREPPGPVMSMGGGGGGGGRWRQSMWIWPLPPRGRLTFVCQWPEAGIELTRAEIDAQLLLDAASRSQVIFAGDPGAA
jgi:hypothetical protein